MDALSREHIRVARAQQDSQERLIFATEETNSALERLDASFQWGFSTLIAEVGSLGESLEKLVRVANTPNRTRAYEYYHDSREAFRRQHLDEALIAVEKALHGDAESTTGYRLDWRFHHLRALVLLGGPGPQHVHVDLDRAAESSARAVEFALSASDFRGASAASLTASWIDYCRQMFDSALDSCARAIEYDPGNPAARFQAAKVLFASDRPSEAISHLTEAIKLDRRYVLRVHEDDDFLAFSAQIGAAFEQHRCQVVEEVRGFLRSELTDPTYWTALSVDELQRTWLALADQLLGAPRAMRILDVLQLQKGTQLLRVMKPGSGTWTLQLLATAFDSTKSFSHLRGVLGEGLSNEWSALRGLHSPSIGLFDFVRLLRSSGEQGLAQVILSHCKNPETGPLELCLSRVDLEANSQVGRQSLRAWFSRQPSTERARLVKELESLAGSSRYGRSSIQLANDCFKARWDEWDPSIRRELEERSLAGTEPPFKGVFGRFVLAFFGVGILLSGIRDFAAGVTLWVLGIAAVIGVGVANRLNIRRERLQKELEQERVLRKRLDATGKGGGKQSRH